MDETTGIDWEAITRILDQEDWQDDWQDPDTQVQSTFLGTVFALMPSGKFYMPWTTNQTADDVDVDEAYRAMLDEEARAHGLFVCPSEGDPCDLLAVRYRSRPTATQDAS